MKIDFTKFSPDTVEPAKGFGDAAGFDIYSVDNYFVRPSTFSIIHTGIGFKTSRGYFGKIHPMSSLTLCLTDVGGGIIDADY